ncbi:MULTISPECIES: helix-turn-helix transcriptional regulator [Caproicibacterium]|uniref:AraC family transcriptional regulator n=1 Tax=Caproicibacterium argilliputei TaxID=3030016 RepID=A0AA97D973_9FIRM|nr:AraC family transcriptional regulator [Caproicibacterium argilliputei]WOC31619.1 AraC family transcriptional regulator [Caproicibacterium argilliputei]
MNHIRYIGYSAVHTENFIFDVPGGHDCWLLLLTHTPALFFVDGTLREYPAKCAVLFAPRQKIYYRACGSTYENDWIRFDSTETYVSTLPVQGRPFLLPDPEYCHSLFQLLTWEHTMPGLNSERTVDQLLRVLFTKLLEACSLKSSFPHYHSLLLMRKEIYNHPQGDWTVPRMAEQLHLSSGYLQVLYKKIFGTSCMEDVIDGRIRMAEDQLLYTDKPVSEVAEQCGYSNLEHFCRQFKKTAGLSPTAFRKQADASEQTFLYHDIQLAPPAQ